MKKKLVLLFISVLFFSCTTSKNNMVKHSSEGVNRDGLTYEKAIIIKETNEGLGVAVEYKWIRDNYPGYKIGRQSLSNHAGKPYDILTITSPQGNETEIYFDISNFFGKF